MIDSLCTIVSGIRGSTLETDLAGITKAVAGDDLLSPPDWMHEFVADIANARYTESLLQIPTGYPRSENGLINSLLEIDSSVCPLGIDDCGEQLQWTLPYNNVTVFVGRETSGDFNYAAIRPADSDLNSWLLDQFGRR